MMLEHDRYFYYDDAVRSIANKRLPTKYIKKSFVDVLLVRVVDHDLSDNIQDIEIQPADHNNHKHAHLESRYLC